MEPEGEKSGNEKHLRVDTSPKVNGGYLTTESLTRDQVLTRSL